MIRLTLKNSNEAWYVNPDHIVSIGKHMNQEGNTYVETTVYDGDCIVAESPEEVARKVLEWRLAIIRYQTAVEKENRDDITFEKWNLKQLSGQLQSAQQEISKLRDERDDLIEGLLVYAEQRIGSDDDGEHARDILKEIGVLSK